MKHNRQKLVWLAALMAVYSVVAVIVSGCTTYAGELPQAGSRYRIIGQLYAVGVYADLNNRRNPSIVSLIPFGISGPEVAFVRLVPVGTIMTIVGSAPKRLPLPFYEDRFYVRLEPTDLPSDLPMIISLYRGNEGSLDGLNPKIFSRVE